MCPVIASSPRKFSRDSLEAAYREGLGAVPGAVLAVSRPLAHQNNPASRGRLRGAPPLPPPAPCRPSAVSRLLVTTLQ